MKPVCNKHAIVGSAFARGVRDLSMTTLFPLAQSPFACQYWMPVAVQRAVSAEHTRWALRPGPFLHGSFAKNELVIPVTVDPVDFLSLV